MCMKDNDQLEGQVWGRASQRHPWFEVQNAMELLSGALKDHETGFDGFVQEVQFFMHDIDRGAFKNTEELLVRMEPVVDRWIGELIGNDAGIRFDLFNNVLKKLREGAEARFAQLRTPAQEIQRIRNLLPESRKSAKDRIKQLMDLRGDRRIDE